MRVLIAFLLCASLLGVPMMALGASCEQSSKHALFYVNGVWNPTRDGARQALYALERLTAEMEGGTERFDIQLAYNDGDGYLSDLVEAAGQRFGASMDWAMFALWVAGDAVPTALEVVYTRELGLATIGKFLPPKTTSEVLREHVSQYRVALCRGQRLVLVAHSQGNFFANATIESAEGLTPIEAANLRIVSVANPDNHIAASNALIGPVTLAEDAVISKVPGAMRALYSNPPTDADNGDSAKHQFVRSYLQEGYDQSISRIGALNSRAAIKLRIASAVSEAPPISRLADTGITSAQCYRAGSNVLVSCLSPEAIALNAQQDGMIGLDVTNPDPSDGRLGLSYVKISSTGAELPPSATEWQCVKDKITGLIWENKNIPGTVHIRGAGRTYTNWGDNRAGDASDFALLVNSTGLCGYADWRVPTIDELQTIVDYGAHYIDGLVIDHTYFQNSQTPYINSNGIFWSSTRMASMIAWDAFFYNGHLGAQLASELNFVRLVRGIWDSGSARFEISADGTEVTDSLTKLVWRRCAEGRTWNGVSCSGTTLFFGNHDAALVHATSQSGWRLPNIKELASIVDRSSGLSGINQSRFPTNPTTLHWSSTPVVSSPGSVWGVDFGNGYIDWDPRSAFRSRPIRLVRSAS